MNIFSKKYLLLFSLLISNTHISHGFFDDLFRLLEALTRTQQQRPHQSIEEHIATLRYNLDGLPHHELNEIVNNTRAALWKVDLSNSRLVSDAINSELALHVRKKVTEEINTIIRRDNIKLDARNCETIVNTYTNDFLKHLGTLSYIATHNIQQFFGDNRTASVTQLIYNAEHEAKRASSQYSQPTQSYPKASPVYIPSQQAREAASAQYTYRPSAPQVPSPSNGNNGSYTREQYAQQHVNFLREKLANNNSIMNKDIEALLSRVRENTTSLRSIPANDCLAHTKQGLAELLDEKLEATKRKLHPLIKNLKKLESSLETTRSNKIADIEKLQTIDTHFIAGLLGNNSEGASNIEDDVITNMGIQCPICFEVFKEEHHHGKVEEIVLKAANSQQQCGHRVCKVCISGCKNTCPLCKAHIDQQDLAQKMRR